MFIDKLRKDRSSKVAVFVDGPNVMRSKFDVDLDALRDRLEDLGGIAIGKVFLNQHASEKLIEAVVSQGFSAELGLGGEKHKDSDVDVYMAATAMEAVYNDNVGTIVLVTRDADFLPVIQKAKERGKKAVVVGTEPAFSTALQNAADEVIELEQ